MGIQGILDAHFFVVVFKVVMLGETLFLSQSNFSPQELKAACRYTG